MNNLRQLIENLFKEKNILRLIFSNPYKKEKESIVKVTVKPFESNEEVKYQFTYHFENRVAHSNLDIPNSIDEVVALITNIFKQVLINTSEKEYHILSNKSGKISIVERANQVAHKELKLTHNREKQYIIKDNTVVPFLVELGVMNLQGKVLNDKYDKFKQINRFIEFVQDIVEEFDTSRAINIIDFGCGKSYLTFAIHYYLTEVLNYKVNIIGLDLKKDVINKCNQIVSKYRMKGIKFQVGDIKDYKETEVDMVVTLHACDTATDYALYNAIKWGSKVILSVPCCQHELNKQIKTDKLKALTDYGIVKERMSALITDVTRAKLLELNGYKTQLLEFIDMEHTPKNILIRAVKRDKNINYKKQKEELDNLKKEFNYNITLDRLLNEKENLDN